MKKPKVTVAQLMARLNADPEWVVMMAKKEEERQKRTAELRRAEAGRMGSVRFYLGGRLLPNPF